MKYTIDTKSQGYPIFYLTSTGQVEQVKLSCADPGQACDEFEKSHRGAKFIAWGDFTKLWKQAEADREKLSAWNSWAANKLQVEKEDEWPWPLPESPYDPDPRDFGGR